MLWWEVHAYTTDRPSRISGFTGQTIPFRARAPLCSRWPHALRTHKMRTQIRIGFPVPASHMQLSGDIGLQEFVTTPSKGLSIPAVLSASMHVRVLRGHTAKHELRSSAPVGYYLPRNQPPVAWVTGVRHFSRLCVHVTQLIPLELGT